MRNTIKLSNVLLLLIVSFVFLFYKRSLHFFFVSDDYYFLTIRSLKDVVSLHPDFYHYNPVFSFLIFIVRKVVGSSPFWFHTITLGIHIVNVLLVFSLSRILVTRVRIALLVSLIFSIFFSHYEVVYWITGINTSLMVTLYLLALVTFIGYCKKYNRRRYILYCVCTSLAILTHEYAITLPIMSTLYFLIFTKRENEQKNLLIFSTISFLFLFIFFRLFFHLSFPLTSINMTTVVSSIVKSVTYILFPFPTLIDRLPHYVTGLIFLVLSLVLFMIIKGSKMGLFLGGWFICSIVLFSLTSLPQARYFYLSSIPAILLFVNFLYTSQRKLLWIYSICVLISGMAFLTRQSVYWQISGEINKNIITQLLRISPLDMQKNMYFIDLPDSINGPPWQAYLFRNGVENIFRVTYGWVPHLEYRRTSTFDLTVRQDPIITGNELKSLMGSKNSTFIYNKGKGTLERL